MDPAAANSISGLHSAAASFANSAARVANAQVPGANVDLAAEFANMTKAKVDFRANVFALDASNKMIGSLFDILA